MYFISKFSMLNLGVYDICRPYEFSWLAKESMLKQHNIIYFKYFKIAVKNVLALRLQS